jgi:peptide/nickel transport system substrate-binding protein
MKNPEEPIPNERLRHARDLKGWSQADLAEQVGTSFEMVSRWERGVTVPGPYYRQHLCVALGQTAEELGLLRRRPEAFTPLPAPADRPVEPPAAATQVPTDVPLLPPPPRTRQRRGSAANTAVLLVALLVVLLAVSSGLGYWLKLGPFGTGATTAMPAPAYVYAQPTHKGGTITFSSWQFPGSTNLWFLGPDGLAVARALWGRPYVPSPTATFLPDELAEIPTQANGDVSKDGKTVTMHLRPDLRWSDGQPLTADDFAYWLEVLLDPTLELFTYGYDQIVSPQVLDDHTLVLHYNHLFASYLFYLPYAAPRHAWGSIPHQDLAETDEVSQYPTVTSGPFMLASYRAGQSMTLAPNPHYVSTTLHQSVLDRLIFTTYPERAAVIAAFEAGQTDVVSGMSIEALPEVGAVPGVHITPSIGYTHLEFNLSHLVELQDEQVRKAIEEAIDRCGIIQTVYQQPCNYLRVDTILPPPSLDNDPTIKTSGYDLARARKDMEIAGWDCSRPPCTRGGQVFPTLNLVTTSGLVTRQQVTALIKQNLAALGIPVALRYYSARELFIDYLSGGILATGQYDLALFATMFSLDDDINFSNFHSSQIPSASNTWGGNWERVNDSNIDSALDQGRMTLNVETRTQLYKSLQRELVAHVYVVPLYLSPNITLVNPTIGNEQDNPIGLDNLWNVGDWFLMK